MGRALCVNRGPFSVGVEGKSPAQQLISQVARQQTRSFDIKSRAVIRWNKFRQIFISYHLATGECPFNFSQAKGVRPLQFINVE
jgi:hypothetical protein